MLSIGVLALIATSCGTDRDASSSSSPPDATATVGVGGEPTAADAVVSWVDTLAIGSYEDADLLVDQAQVVLLISVQSYSPGIYEQLTRDGVDSEMTRDFWASFAGELEAFTGVAITEVVVGEERSFEADGRSFAEVDFFSSRGEATVIAIEDGGRWYVDVLATFGRSFSSLFNLWIERLPPDATAPRGALAEQSVSLTVARDRLDPELDAEAVTELNLLLDRLAG